MPQPWGLLTLFAAALAVLCVWGGVITALQALKPPRKAFAWALATGRPRDPAALGLAFEEIACGGGRHPAPAWLVRGRATSAEAPMLLLLHGWGRSRWDSLGRVASFVDACAAMVLPDLPAHGEHRAAFSSVGAREPALALRVAQDMAQRWPGRPLILAGHSLGAGVALRAAVAAERAGLPVAGVIAFAPYRTLRSPIPARLALKGLPRFPLAEVAVLALRALRCMDQPLENDARALRAPLLVMAGDHDPISPAADARALASAAPRATLVELPFVRHDDLREGDPQRHDRALAEFLAAITARPAAAGARA